MKFFPIISLQLLRSLLVFMNKVQENPEHKQKKSPDSSDFQNQEVRSPDMLIIMRACFVLLLAMCKTLNEQSLRIANLSNPSFPVITISPTQALALLCEHVREDQQLPLCVQIVPDLANVTGMMSSAGMVVTVWYRFTRAVLQAWKEKVIIHVVSYGLDCSNENAIKSIEELKQRRIVKK